MTVIVNQQVSSFQRFSLTSNAFAETMNNVHCTHQNYVHNFFCFFGFGFFLRMGMGIDVPAELWPFLSETKKAIRIRDIDLPLVLFVGDFPLFRFVFCHARSDSCGAMVNPPSQDSSVSFDWMQMRCESGLFIGGMHRTWSHDPRLFQAAPFCPLSQSCRR
jgi:hypothetical protein